MSSPKLEANRSNASRSTGPRSAAGKQQSARNAFKHGLSVAVLRDPYLAEEVTRLAHHIAGGNEQLLEVSERIAEAEVDVLRVRRLRAELINQALGDPNFTGEKGSVRLVQRLIRVLDAAEGKRGLSEADQQYLRERLDRKHESLTERHARVLVGLSAQLAKLDRYERRALSRRKVAIRRLDAQHKR